MQTPSIPAWTYQGPFVNADHPEQLYYRSRGVYLDARFPKQRAARPALAVKRYEAAADVVDFDGLITLTVDTGCGRASIELDQAAALTFRDALNDAIEDCIKAQLFRAAQQMNQAEVPA